MHFNTLKPAFVLFDNKNVVCQGLIEIVDFVNAYIFGLYDIFPEPFVHSCDEVHIFALLAVLDDNWF
jgi:hypothetical protein